MAPVPNAACNGFKRPASSLDGASPTPSQSPLNGASPRSPNGQPPPTKRRAFANAPSGSNGSLLAKQNGYVDEGILEAKARLPITAGREAIVQAVRDNDTVVVLGETGSGKTTQIPQYLYQAGFTKASSPSGKPRIIGVTQPRRVAAISLAKRVAAELGCPEPGESSARHKLKGKGKGASPSSSEAGEVGYSIRFDDSSSERTRIKFMTDGWLLREMQMVDSRSGKAVKSGPKHNLLENYSVLVIDEAHERSVQTDLVLGMAKRIQRERREKRKAWLEAAARGQTPYAGGEEPTELKIVIMSATLDAEAFADFFSTPASASKGLTAQPAPILYIKGRTFPVELFHTVEPAEDWANAAKQLVLSIHLKQPPGDILVFATGAEEIESLRVGIEALAAGLPTFYEGLGKPTQRIVVAPIYAALGPQAVTKVFAPTQPNTRKVVLATNIAETSITIPGIKYVVDCGLAKQRSFRQAGGGQGGSIETLTTQPISKSAARQRTGRAGRDAAGHCYRLYPQDVFEELEEATQPEILRTDLSPALLDIFAMGLDPFEFDWMDRPDDVALTWTVVGLVELGALEPVGPGEDGRERFEMTDLGRKMAGLPLPPHLSRTLLAAAELGPKVAREARDLVAILSSDRASILMDPPPRPPGSGVANDAEPDPRDEAAKVRASMAHPSGDHATQLVTLYSYMRVVNAPLHSAAAAASANDNVNLNLKKPKLAKARREEAKAWCASHYVSSRAVQQVLKIRAQLRQICSRAGIVCDDEDGVRRGSGGRSRTGGDDAQGEDSDCETEASNTSGLFVTRGTGGGKSSGSERSFKDEDFSDLRRALMQGRMSKIGVLSKEEGAYVRLVGGDRFKIHPSSSLFGRRPPGLILFEELSFTSQVYARTVCAVEPAWLEGAREALVVGMGKGGGKGREIREGSGKVKE